MRQGRSVTTPFWIAAGVGLALSLAAAGAALAWGHTGHRFIGYLAVEQLPEEIPVFLRASAADIGELAREPDRSKGSGRIHDTDRDPAHFLDLDDQGRVRGGPSITDLPATREDFEAALQRVHGNSWDEGYLPYSTVAAWQQLKTDFAYYRVLTAALAQPQTPERRLWLEQDLRRRQAQTLQDIGLLAHYVGDGSQPLHMSIHYNGWGNYPNPRHYTTQRIHGPFEGDFVSQNVTLEGVRTAMTPYRDCQCAIEARVAGYLRTTWTFVEPFYQLWDAGGFRDNDARGREFATTRVAAGASELRDLIVDAWRASAGQKVGWPAIGEAEVRAGADPWVALHGQD
jgi:hypothetical protein